MTYLLDTSVYSEPLKRLPLEPVIRRWREAGDAACTASVFCEMEVLQGIHMSGSERLQHLFSTVLEGKLSLIDFSRPEAEIYAQLQAQAVQQGGTRPVIDLCIAATALRHGLILATLNAKDFAGIPGLRVEDWGEE